MRQLDPFDILHRGQADMAALTADEQLVFSVMELEAQSLMEGWDHFFVYSPAFAHYDLMKAGLAAAGDGASLDVLRDYERWLGEHGCPVDAAAIDALVTQLAPEELSGAPDWTAMFERVTGERWQRIAAYLRSHDVELLGG
jgi:hypothetical protein